jgi:hypothetical protein
VITLRSLLVLCNLAAWCVQVLLRPPLPASYFAARDEARAAGGFFHNSADPLVVIAGRPLWSWSAFHGGERAAVKLLEVANLVPVVIVALASAFPSGQSHRHSFFMFSALLFLTSLQWWSLGHFVTSFRAWRRSRQPQGR